MCIVDDGVSAPSHTSSQVDRPSSRSGTSPKWGCPRLGTRNQVLGVGETVVPSHESVGPDPNRRGPQRDRIIAIIVVIFIVIIEGTQHVSESDLCHDSRNG